MTDSNKQELPGKANTRQWFLKIDEGKVFGPTHMPTLLDWARQGRIAPGHQVSEDKKAWINAERIPELEMVWMVELADGSFYGPLNIHAVSDLVTEGTVAADAAMINQLTNEKTTVAGRDAIIQTASPVSADMPVAPVIIPQGGEPRSPISPAASTPRPPAAPSAPPPLRSSPSTPRSVPAPSATASVASSTSTTASRSPTSRSPSTTAR